MPRAILYLIINNFLRYNSLSMPLLKVPIHSFSMRVVVTMYTSRIYTLTKSS